MSRGRQSLNLKKVVKWVVIVTIIIAAIEIPFVYFYFKKEDKTATVLSKPALTIEEKSTNIINQPTQDTTSIIAVENLPKPEVAPVKAPNFSTDTSKQKPAPVVKNKDTSQPTTPKPLVVKKTLTNTQMQDVVDQVNAKRAKSGSAMKCVKIRQTASSNVSNGFKIADALKSNGYIISGRETVSSKVIGILVTGGSDCMVVTVGSL